MTGKNNVRDTPYFLQSRKKIMELSQIKKKSQDTMTPIFIFRGQNALDSSL